MSQPIMGRRLPQEDAADARAKVRRPTDRECVDVERSLLKPTRVVGVNVSAPIRISRPSTSPLEDTMMMRIGTNRNSTKKSLRHLPHGGCQLS